MSEEKQLDKKERYKLMKIAYANSEVGKENRKKWSETEKGKKAIAKANKRYVQSGKRQAWLETKNGIAYTVRVNSQEEENRRKSVNFKVSELIKTKRLENGLTQEELAKKVMVSTSLVQVWERGRALPVFEKCYPLSEALGIKFNRDLKPLIDEARKKSEESLKAKKYE